MRPVAFLLLFAACASPPAPAPPSGAGWSTIRQGYSSFSAVATQGSDGVNKTLSVSQAWRVEGYLPPRPKAPTPTLKTGQPVTRAALKGPRP